MVFAVRGLARKEKTDRQYVTAFLSFVGALYTMQMMEFNLIMTFAGGSNNAMYMMQLFSQGFIFLFALFVVSLFVFKAIQRKNERSLTPSKDE